MSEDKFEKFRQSLDPIERLLRDLESPDHYITIEDMSMHAGWLSRFYGRNICPFMQDELMNRFCRTFG
jgi:hypothetical protein